MHRERMVESRSVDKVCAGCFRRSREVSFIGTVFVGRKPLQVDVRTVHEVARLWRPRAVRALVRENGEVDESSHGGLSEGRWRRRRREFSGLRTGSDEETEVEGLYGVRSRAISRDDADLGAGNSEDGESRKTMKVLTSMKNPGLWALATYSAYLLGGCATYMGVEHWSFSDAMYFTVQTGLGVGYGDLMPSTSASMIFTSGYVLVGNVFFAAALAMFVEAEFRFRDQLNGLLNPGEDDGFWTKSGFAFADESQLDHSLRGFPLLFRDLRVLGRSLRRTSPPDAFTAFVEWVYIASKGEIKDDADQRGVALLRRDLRQFVSNFMKSIIGKAAMSYALLGSWILFGTAYGYTVEHYDLPYSLLYSVSCITTFGIISPPETFASRWFSVMFTGVGFAIYLNSVGKIAGVLVEQFELEQNDAKKQRAKMTSSGDSRVCNHRVDSYASFLESELLRRGYVDEQLIADVRTSYEKLRSRAQF